jgi:hypothetical protein
METALNVGFVERRLDRPGLMHVSDFTEPQAQQVLIVSSQLSYQMDLAIASLTCVIVITQLLLTR